MDTYNRLMLMMKSREDEKSRKSCSTDKYKYQSHTKSNIVAAANSSSQKRFKQIIPTHNPHSRDKSTGKNMKGINSSRNGTSQATQKQFLTFYGKPSSSKRSTVSYVLRDHTSSKINAKKGNGSIGGGSSIFSQQENATINDIMSKYSKPSEHANSNSRNAAGIGSKTTIDHLMKSHGRTSGYGTTTNHVIQSSKNKSNRKQSEVSRNHFQ